MGDKSWKQVAYTIDAGAKIYGYRVDKLQADTYSILGGINRTDDAPSADAAKAQAAQNQRHEREQQEKEAEEHLISERVDYGGKRCIERDPSKIEITQYDLQFEVDPLFQKTSAKFDEQGINGLLLNNLLVDNDLQMQLYSKDDELRAAEIEADRLEQYEKRRANYWELGRILEDPFQKLGAIFRKSLCPQLVLFREELKSEAKDLFNVSKLDITRVEVEPLSFSLGPLPSSRYTL